MICARASAHCKDLCRGNSTDVDTPPVAPSRPFASPKDNFVGGISLPPNRGLHRTGADGVPLPILPYGFYQYENDFAIPLSEAYSGMSLTAPYVSTVTPDDAWFAKMDQGEFILWSTAPRSKTTSHTSDTKLISQFMDDCASINFLVHFQLIGFEHDSTNSPEIMANITAQVNRYKNHPALFAWYLADEPDGEGIPLEWLQPKYDLIKELDVNHPVSMVFCAGGAKDYLSALDMIMVDIYPIPGR